jgi:hypothetical protein
MKNDTVALMLVLLVLSCSVHGAASGSSETDSAKPTSAGQVLRFTARPVKPTFRIGEDVVLEFRLKNLSKMRVFVSRYMPEEFAGVTLIGPDGKEVPWHGRVRSVAYSKDAFLFLEPSQEVFVSRTISEVESEGFAITKPGRYTVVAEYSLGPPEYFPNLAPTNFIPQGVFRARESHFTVTASKDAKP